MVKDYIETTNRVSGVPVGQIDTKYLKKLRLSKSVTSQGRVRKIAMYLRVSTREQAISGYGLDAQMENVLLALKNSGIEDHEVYLYVDDGYSAKDLKRPDMQELLKDVLNGSINEIVIYKLDRLARNVVDVYELLQFFIDQDCELRAIVDNLDIHSANGRLLVGVLAIISQWERETIKERTVDALSMMCMEGKFPVGYTPYGYIKEDSILLIDYFEANIVRYLFDLAASGETMKMIEKKSNIVFPGFKKNSERIRKIITKEIYYGKFSYMGKVYENVVPAIISKEIYDEANKAVFKRYKVTDHNKYYFANKVKCTCGPICEHKSTKKKNKKYYYYVCPKCNKRINQEVIIKSILIRIFAQALKENKNSQQKKICNRINHLDKKTKKVFDRYISSEIDVMIYASTIAAIDNERKELEHRVNILMDIQKNLGLELFQWHEMTDEKRRLFIDEYVKGITVDPILKLLVFIEF